MLALKLKPVFKLARGFTTRLGADPLQVFADIAKLQSTDNKVKPKFLEKTELLKSLLEEASPKFGTTAFKKNFEVKWTYKRSS